MGNIVGLLGWVTAALAGAALLNFVLKFVGRTYLKKVPKKYARQVDTYRSFMKFMVKNHRFFGQGALVILLAHAALVILGSALSVTGGVAALCFITTASLGGYGFYVRKDNRAPWLMVHRTFAFFSLLGLGAHFVYKGVIFI